MSNTFKVIDMIAKEGLAIAHEKATFVSTINRQYDESFKPQSMGNGRIGGTLRVRDPNQYEIRTSGRVMDVQDQDETTQTITLATQYGVDMRFTSADLALNVDDPSQRSAFSKRFIEPAVGKLLSKIDGDCLQTATLEQEFAYDWQDPDCHLWFFDGGLPGYAWYVPKANGYINVGLGGMAGKLKRRNGHLRDYWRDFTRKLKSRGLVDYDNYEPKGYSYFVRGEVKGGSDGNVFIVGDAVGLATRDMCEGIGPAIKSGLLAARAIATGEQYSLAGIDKFSGGGFASKLLERKFAGAQ